MLRRNGADDGLLQESLSASECGDFDGGNIMFFSPANDSRALTSQQGQVLLNNPLVQ